MTLTQIKKFENLNDISINVSYREEKGILDLFDSAHREEEDGQALICYMCRTTTWDISRGSRICLALWAHN